MAIVGTTTVADAVAVLLEDIGSAVADDTEAVTA
jgi:hypothetical protein